MEGGGKAGVDVDRTVERVGGGVTAVGGVRRGC